MEQAKHTKGVGTRSSFIAIHFIPSIQQGRFFCNTNDTYVLFGSILFVGEIDKMFHFVINAGSFSVLLGVVVSCYSDVVIGHMCALNGMMSSTTKTSN